MLLTTGLLFCSGQADPQVYLGKTSEEMLQIAADIALVGKLHHIRQFGKLDARSLTGSFLGRGDGGR